MNFPRPISKYRAANILISVLLLVFAITALLPQPALAQTQPASNQNVVLNKDKWDRAQLEKDYCLGEFSDDVRAYSSGALKANYDDNLAPNFLSNLIRQTEPCYIVPSSAPDSDRMVKDIASSRYRPLSIIEFESQLKYSTQGVNKEDLDRTAATVAQDQQAASSGSKFVGWILSFLIKVLTTVILYITAMAGGLFTWVIDEARVGDAIIVEVGWKILRDFMNMFFILALIAMSLATILQIETYNYKKLLTKLIIMALLINFSKVISLTLIQFTDIIVDALRNGANWTRPFIMMQGMLGVEPSQYGSAGEIASAFFSSGGVGSDLVLSISGLILALVMLVTFLAVGGLLVIRLMGLYVLVILSPIAYALNILPATEQYAKKWWETFIKYLIWAPVAIFFMRLADYLLTQGGGTKSIYTGGNSVFSFVIIIAFYWAAVLVAKQAGMVGADAVIKGAQAVGFGAPAWLGKRGLGWLGRHYNEATAKYIRGGEEKVSKGRAVAYAVANPMAFFKGWNEEAEEKKHRAKEKAVAAGREVVDQRFASPKSFLKGGYKIIPRVAQVEAKEDAEKAKEYMNLSREEISKRVHELANLGNSEDDMSYKRAIMRVAMSKGYVDDIAGLAHTNDEGKKLMAKMIVKGKLSEEEGDFLTNAAGNYIDLKGNEVDESKRVLNYSSDRVRRAVHMAMFGGELQEGFVDSKTGEFYQGERRQADDEEAQNYTINDHAASKMIAEHGEEAGKETDHWEYMTDRRYDEKTGHYISYALRKRRVKVKDDEGNEVDMGSSWISDGHSAMASAELAKKNSRTQAQAAWHSFMSADGRDVYDTLEKSAKALAENPTFAQERTANMLIAGTTDEKILQEIRHKYATTGVLEIDAISAQRLQKMKAIDPKMLAAVFQRFMNDAQGQGKVDNRIKDGLDVRVVVRNGETHAVERVVKEKEHMKLKIEREVQPPSVSSAEGPRIIPSVPPDLDTGPREKVR